MIYIDVALFCLHKSEVTENWGRWTFNTDRTKRSNKTWIQKMLSKVCAYEMVNIFNSQKEASCEQHYTNTIDIFIIDQNDQFAALKISNFK